MDELSAVSKVFDRTVDFLTENRSFCAVFWTVLLQSSFYLHQRSRIRTAGPCCSRKERKYTFSRNNWIIKIVLHHFPIANLHTNSEKIRSLIRVLRFQKQATINYYFILPAAFLLRNRFLEAESCLIDGKSIYNPAVCRHVTTSTNLAWVSAAFGALEQRRTFPAQLVASFAGNQH